MSFKFLTMISVVLSLAACSQEVPQVQRAPAQANQQPEEAAQKPQAQERQAVEHLQITPRSFRTCDTQGGVIAVKASWDVGSINVRNVSIYVESPGNARKLWLEGGASGAEATGVWVFDKTKFTLLDRDSGTVLDEVLVNAEACNGST